MKGAIYCPFLQSFHVHISRSLSGFCVARLLDGSLNGITVFSFLAFFLFDFYFEISSKELLELLSFIFLSMNLNNNLFEKYKDFKFNKSNTLFEINLLDAVIHKVCPYCLNKLYPMRKKPYLYCRSRKHKNKFIISKHKVKQ